MQDLRFSHADVEQAPDLTPFIRPGDTIMWGQATAQPLLLTQALLAQRARLPRLRLFLGIGLSELFTPDTADAFDFVSYCGAGTNRALAKAGLLDILPVHYSDLPGLIRSGQLRIDVLMLQVAPPDARGNYSLGLANEYLGEAIKAARTVIAEVNPHVPWTHGDVRLRQEDFALLVESNSPPLQFRQPPAGAVEQAIGAHVASLVPDGATLQIGIGTLPEACLASLSGLRDLGIHSGAIGDTVARLAEEGVITNARKTVDRGVTVCGLLMGGARLARYADRNPAVSVRGTAYTHAADILALHERFIALNSAVEVDLGGQINAETAGGVYVGAVGGALDFARAARRSRGGMSICALPSTAGSRSRIVTRLSGPATVPASDAGVIVTEFGIADLRGKSHAARAQALVRIAHPDHRERLESEAHGDAGRGRP